MAEDGSARWARDTQRNQAELRWEHEEQVLIADRERIARELNELVIQRLFMASLALHTGMALIEQSEPAQRIAAVVDQLDDTIRVMRSAIFGLEQTHRCAIRQPRPIEGTTC
jgi:signal transduction histidine kinase